MSSKSSIRIAHHCYKLGTLHGELPQVKTREGSHLLAKASDFGCKRTLRFLSCETARVLSRLGVGKKRDSRKVHGIELAIRSRGNIHSWKAIAWSLPGDFNPVGKPRARTHHNPSSRKFCEQGRNRSLIPFFFMQKRTPPGFPWLPLRSLHPSPSPHRIPSVGSPVRWCFLHQRSILILLCHGRRESSHSPWDRATWRCGPAPFPWTGIAFEPETRPRRIGAAISFPSDEASGLDPRGRPDRRRGGQGWVVGFGPFSDRPTPARRCPTLDPLLEASGGASEAHRTVQVPCTVLHMAQARTTAELVRDLPKLRPNPSISLESYWKSTGKLVTQVRGRKRKGRS